MTDFILYKVPIIFTYAAYHICKNLKVVHFPEMDYNNFTNLLANCCGVMLVSNPITKLRTFECLSLLILINQLCIIYHLLTKLTSLLT